MDGHIYDANVRRFSLGDDKRLPKFKTPSLIFLRRHSWAVDVENNESPRARSSLKVCTFFSYCFYIIVDDTNDDHAVKCQNCHMVTHDGCQLNLASPKCQLVNEINKSFL